MRMYSYLMGHSFTFGLGLHLLANSIYSRSESLDEIVQMRISALADRRYFKHGSHVQIRRGDRGPDPPSPLENHKLFGFLLKLACEPPRLFSGRQAWIPPPPRQKFLDPCTGALAPVTLHGNNVVPTSMRCDVASTLVQPCFKVV